MTLQSSTLKFRKDLIQNGMSEELAETVINGFHEVATGDLATKADLADLKAELKGDVADLKGEIGELKADLKGDIARSQVTIILSIAVMLGVSLSIYAFLSGVGQAPAP